jgi:hypothetical protein
MLCAVTARRPATSALTPWCVLTVRQGGRVPDRLLTRCEDPRPKGSWRTRVLWEAPAPLGPLSSGGGLVFHPSRRSCSRVPSKRPLVITRSSRVVRF